MSFCSSKKVACAGRSRKSTPSEISKRKADLVPIPPVLGLNVDLQTRCAHYHSPRDVVAIRMKCCDTWYACVDCHAALAGHAVQRWPRSEWDERVILCGACGAEITIRDYLESGDACPACGAAFNPGCREHHHLYFEI